MTDPLSQLAQLNAAPLANMGLRLAAGPEQGRDLYEVWSSIFGRARSEQPPADHNMSERGPQLTSVQPGSALATLQSTRAQASAAWADVAQGQEDPAADSAGMRPSTSADTVMALPPGLDTQHVALNSTGAAVSSADSKSGRDDLAPGAVARLTSKDAPTDLKAGDSLPDVAKRPAGATTAEVAVSAGPSAAPAENAPAADSVRVFVKEQGVEIVVRDGGITPQEALRCAFDSAQRLTGQRTALQRLTLNGHTLYQRDAAAAVQSTPALLFAC